LPPILFLPQRISQEVTQDWTRAYAAISQRPTSRDFTEPVLFRTGFGRETWHLTPSYGFLAGPCTKNFKNLIPFLIFLGVHFSIFPKYFNKTDAYSRLPLWSSGHSSWPQIQRSGFDSRRYQIFWEVVSLERGPLSLVSTVEELLGSNISGSGLENRQYGRRFPSSWPRGTLYPQKLALTSRTSGGRSVGVVRSRSFLYRIFEGHNSPDYPHDKTCNSWGPQIP
jgi:hypothetical protein